MQIGFDVGQCDVHDCRVENDHQLSDQDDRDAERCPASAAGLSYQGAGIGLR